MLGIFTEQLVIVAAGALCASLLEGAFKKDALSRLVAHLVAAALLLIVLFLHYSGQALSIRGVIAAITSKPALYFIGISAGLASILELFLRQHAFLRFAAHFVALLVGMWFLD
jgi:hypothetical protein